MENRPRRDLVSIRTVLDRSNTATPHQSDADGTQSLPDGHASITDNTHTAAPPAPTAAAASPPGANNNESLLSLSAVVTLPQTQLQGGGNIDAATHALPSQTGTTEDDGILVDKTDLQDDAHHAILGGTGTGTKPPRPTSARARPGSARSRPGSARRVTATTAPLLGAAPGATGAQASSINEDASPLDKGSRGSDIPQLRESSDLNMNDPSSRAGSTPHGQGSEAARSASSQATTPDVVIPDFSHRSGSRLSATEDDVGAPLEDTGVGSNPQAVDVNDKQISRSALQAGEAAATERQANVDAVTDKSDRPVEQPDQRERQPSESKDDSAPKRQSPTTDQAELRKDEPDGSAEVRAAVTSTTEEGAAEATEQKSPAPVVSEIKEPIADQNGRSSESDEKSEEASLAPKVLFEAADGSNSATSLPHAAVVGETHDAAHASDKHNPLQDPVREAPHQSVDTSVPIQPQGDSSKPSSVPAVAAATTDVEDDGARTTGSHQPERSPSAIPRAAPASMPAVDVNRFWHNEDEEDEQFLRMEENELAAARALTAAITSRAALSSSFPSLPGGTTSDSAQDTTSVKEATQEEAVQEVAEEEATCIGAGQHACLSSSSAQPDEVSTPAKVEESEKAAGPPNVGSTPPEGVRFVDRVDSGRDPAPQVKQREHGQEREEAARAQPMYEIGRVSETASRDAEEQKRPSATSVDTAHAEMVRFVGPPADAAVPLGDQPSGNAQSSNNASVVSKRSTTSQKIELSTPGPTPSDSIPVQLSGTASDAGTKDSRHRHRRKHRRRRQTSDAAPSITAAGSPDGAADSVVRDLGTSVADAARVDSLESEATDAGRKRLEPSRDALPPDQPVRVLDMPVQTPSTAQQEEEEGAPILATPGHDDQRSERKDRMPSSHRRRRHHRDRRASADVETPAKATDQTPRETTPSAIVPPLPSSRPDFSAANHDDENLQVQEAQQMPVVPQEIPPHISQEIPHAQEPSRPIAREDRSDVGVDRRGPDSPPPSPNGGATDTTRQEPPVVVAHASEDAESPIEAQPSSSVVLEVDPPPSRSTAAPVASNATLRNTGVELGSASPAESPIPSACDAATPVEALPSSSVVLQGQEDDFRGPPQPSAEPQSRAGVAARPASESAESPVEALPSSSVVLEGQREFGAAQPPSAEPQVERSTDDGRPASVDDFLRRSGRSGAATISDVDVVECEARAYVLSDEADAVVCITASFRGALARALIEEEETAARQDFMSCERQGRTAAVEQGLLRSAQQRHAAPVNASALIASTSHHDVSAPGQNSASDVAVQRSPMDEDTYVVAVGAGNENAPNQYPVPVPVGEGGDKQEATPLAPAEIVNSSSSDNDHGAEDEVPSKITSDDIAEEESTAAAIAAAAVTGSVEDAVSLAVIGAATEATIENVAVAALVAEETNIRLDINEAEQKALFDATTEHERTVKSDAEKRAHEESQRLDRVSIEESEHQSRGLAETEEAHVMTQLHRSSHDEAETIKRAASQAVAQEFAVTVLVGEAEGQARDARTTQTELEVRRHLERRFDTEKSELLDRNALSDVATLSGEELIQRHMIEGNDVSTRAALQSQAMADLNEVQKQKTVVPVPVSSQKVEKSPATPLSQSPLQALLAQITASPKPDRPLTTTTDALPSARANDVPSVSTPKVGSPEVAALDRSGSPLEAALEEAAQGFVVAILVEAAEAQSRDALTAMAEPQARASLEGFCEINQLELLARDAITNSTSLELQEALARGDVERSELMLRTDADLSLRVAQQTDAVAVRQQKERDATSADSAEAVAVPGAKEPSVDMPTATPAESAETTTTPSREAAPDSSKTPKTPKEASGDTAEAVADPSEEKLGADLSTPTPAESAETTTTPSREAAPDSSKTPKTPKEASGDTAEAVADPSEEKLGADLSTPTPAESAETTTTPSREAAPDSSKTPKTPKEASGDTAEAVADPSEEKLGADLSTPTPAESAETTTTPSREAAPDSSKTPKTPKEASGDTAEAVADPSEEKLGADLSTPTPAESAETTTTPSREAAPDSSKTPKTPNLGAPLQALLAQITRSPADRSISSPRPTPTDRPALTAVPAAPAAPAAPPLGPLGSAVPTTGALNTNANVNSLTGDGSVGRSGVAGAGSSAGALLPPAVAASAPVGSNSGAKVNGDGAASSPTDAPALITTTTRGRPSVPIIGGRGRPSVPFTPSASGISFSPTGRASLSARGRGPSSSARMSRSVSPTASSPDGRTWRQRKSFIAGDIDDEGSRERLERARQYRASSRSAERSDGGDSFVDGTSPFGPTPAHALIETTPEAGAVIEAASPAPFNNGASGLEQNRSNEPTTPEAVKSISVEDGRHDPVTPKTPEAGQLLEGGDASPGLASDGAAQETMLPPDVTETEAGTHATSAASTPDGRSQFDEDHPDALDNVSPKAAGFQVQGQGETSDVAQPPSVPIAKTVQLPSVHRTVAVVRRSPLVVVKMIPRRMVTTSVFKSTPPLVRKRRPIRQRTFATVRATPILTRKWIPARVFVHVVKKQTPVVTREIVALSSTTNEGAAPSVLEGYRKELSVLESQQGAASSARTVQISEESLIRAGLTDAQIAAVLSGRSTDSALASSVSVVDDHFHATDRGAAGPAGREGEKDEKLHITTTRETNTDGVEPALLDHQTQTSPPDIVLPVADVGVVDPVRDVVDATDENASPGHVQESGSETPVEQHTVDEPGAAEPGDAVVVLPLEEPRSLSVGREVQTDDLVVEDLHPRSESVGREVQTDDLTTAEDDEKRRHEQQELVSEVVSVGMHGLMSLFFQEQEKRDKLVREEHMRRFLMKDEQEVEVIARQFDNPRSITARLETMESAARTVLLVNMEWQAAHFTQCASLLFEKLHRAHVTTVQEKYERIRCEDAKDFIIFQARSGGFGGYGNERREHGARASKSDRRSEQTKDEEGADGSVPLTPTAPAQDQAARNQSRRELYADRTIGAEDNGGVPATGTGRKGPRLFTAAPSRSHGGVADVFASAATKATERLAAFPSPQQYARTNVEVRPDDGLEMMRTRGDGGGLATCLFARKEHADTAAASSASPAKDPTAVPSSGRTLEANNEATDAVGADTASIPPLAETPATHNGDTATDTHHIVDGGDDNGHEQAPPSVVDSFEDTMRSCYTPFGAIPRLAPTPDHEATNGSLPTPRSAAYHSRPMSSTTPGVKRPTAPGPRPPSGRPPQRPASAAVISRSTELEMESKKNGWGDQGEVASANRQSPNEPEQETDGANVGAMSGKDGVDATQEKLESEERENFFGRRAHETQFPSTYSPAALPQRLIPRRPCASPQRTAVDRTVSPPRLVPSSREHVPAPSMNSHGQSVGRDERTHPAAYERATAVEREHGSARSGASATQPQMESATEEAAYAVVRVIPSPQRQCPARFDGTTPVVAAKESPARDRTVDATDDEEEQRNASQDNSPAAAAASIEEGEAIARTPTPPPATVARSAITAKTTNRPFVSGSGAQTPRGSATTGAVVTPQRPATAAARRGVPFPGRRMSAPDRPGSTLPAVAGAGSRVPTRPASVASGASNGGPLRHGVLPSNRKILSNAASSRTVDSW